MTAEAAAAEAKPPLGLVLALGALAATTATATDICIPSLPDIALHYGQAPAAGAGLVSSYFWGYALGQLAWGVIADRFGRIGSLMASLVGFVITAIACAVAPSFTVLLIARLIQGLCGAAAPVVVRAIARDQGGGRVTARLLASTSMIIGLAPLLAPSLGAGLAALFDWQANFWFLAIFGVSQMAVAWFVLVPNMGPSLPAPAEADRPSYGRRVWSLLKTWEFTSGALVVALVGIGYFTFLSIGSAAARERFGTPPEAFGALFAIPAAFLLAGAFWARQMAGRLRHDVILLAACGIGAIGGVGILVSSVMVIPQWLFWSFAAVYISAFGAVGPVGAAKAMEPAGRSAGVAASLIGLMSLSTGALVGQLASSGLLGPSAYHTLCLQLGLGAVACLAFQLMVFAMKRRRG